MRAQLISVAAETSLIPPRPRAAASAAAHKRWNRSGSWGIRSWYLALTASSVDMATIPRIAPGGIQRLAEVTESTLPFGVTWGKSEGGCIWSKAARVQAVKNSSTLRPC